MKMDLREKINYIMGFAVKTPFGIGQVVSFCRHTDRIGVRLPKGCEYEARMGAFTLLCEADGNIVVYIPVDECDSAN